MAKITVKEVTDKAEWEGLVADYEEANFLQSWYWGEFQQAIKHEIYRSGFYVDDKLVGVMLSVVEPARRARYLTVPAGPIIDWRDRDVVDAAVNEMKRVAKSLSCVFVRVRPQLESNEFSQKLFASNGFKPAQMHLHAELTSQLDIGRELEDIKKGFRKNTRYELKRAKKRGIVVTETADPAAIKEFYDLQLETAERHGFVPFSYDFLHEQFKVFAAAGKVLLYSAKTQEGELIAQAFVIFYNQEAAYHYGASTQLGRKEPGAYLVQWKAIEEAKARGIGRYNFWGVVPVDDTKHRFYGVSVFKRGFRGHDIEYLHAQDLALSRPRYMLNWLVEFVRKRKRNV